MNTARLIIAVGLTAFFTLAVCLKAAPAEVCLVSEGRPNAVIAIPTDLPPPSEQTGHPFWIEFNLMRSHARTSAEILAAYVRKSTGAELPILTEDEVPAGTNAIHIGDTALAGTRAADIAELDDDGFLIAVPDRSRVLLAGATPQGTEFAVYDFLERELGVRWLFPGELGEHVPSHEDLCVSGPDLLSEPAFLSRLFFVRGEGGREWTRRNRVHSRIEFHHNISKLIPISFTKTNPEFFPLIDGNRRLPVRQNEQNWHLCYSAEGLVDAVSDLIVRNFTSHPEYASISLGVSDAPDRDYCRCDPCLAKRGQGLNSLGYPHYSDMYYQWANQVVEQVLAERPGKQFGCSAYREVTDPPSFPLHERLVPYLTWELLQWVDPSRREAWKAQVGAWSKQARHFGHYEYMFGEQHMHVPRLYPHVLADYLRYANERGAVGFYAETTGSKADTVWYAGPQPYILLRLLWDPRADVDALLQGWCAAAVGPDAAPHLEAWFRQWERIWTEQVPQTAWFETGSRTYLKFNSDNYLAAVQPEDLAHGEEHLARAAEAAAEGIQRRRADLFLAEFRRRRAEHLDYQVAVWALENRLADLKPGTNVYHEAFKAETEAWVPFSSNDTEPVVHDARLGALHFTGNSSISAPAIPLEPGGAYVVSWRIKADQVPAVATVSFLMDATSEKQGPTTYAVKRHLKGTQLPTDWRYVRHAFRARADSTAGAELKCTIFARGLRSGGVWLDEFTVSPLSSIEERDSKPTPIKADAL